MKPRIHSGGSKGELRLASQEQNHQKTIRDSTGIQSLLHMFPQSSQLRGGAATVSPARNGTARNGTATDQQQEGSLAPPLRQRYKDLVDVLDNINRTRQALSKRWRTPHGSLVHSLHRAISRNDPTGILMVLRLVKSLPREFLNLQDMDNGATAIHMAAQLGHNLCLGILLKYGADVNARDFLGRTPLMAAVATGRSDIIKLLLDNGADIRCRDVFNYSAADYIPKDLTVEYVFPEEYRSLAHGCLIQTSKFVRRKQMVRREHAKQDIIGHNIEGQFPQQLRDYARKILRSTKEQTNVQQQHDLDYILQQTLNQMTHRTKQEHEQIKSIYKGVYGKNP